eukprot:CAMPEP_0115835530 /NCGR_PEP_ID=MMETSP0287-20121206/4240_1 /TAXON_ID=412157 /ORGANISM="Chrysochromulina rotalis, Strain UIO044" /LENGTH=212 /DNA_ID=CAMNT_0003288987 /DNA_START=208 /DNA_END=846 /DNA_ORIENTATION=+
MAYRLGHRHGSRHAGTIPLGRTVTALSKQALKAQLMKHLMHHAYVKLSPSSIDGVGVFAVVDIPEGVNPFAAPNHHLCAQEVSIPIRAEELAACPAAVIEYVLEFHAEMDKDDCIAEAAAEECVLDASPDDTPVYVGINATGLVTMDVSWYLNHSESPNVETVEAEAEGQFSTYRTMRVIRAGEELLTDYRDGLESMYAKICERREAKLRSC